MQLLSVTHTQDPGDRRRGDVAGCCGQSPLCLLPPPALWRQGPVGRRRRCSPARQSSRVPGSPLIPGPSKHACGPEPPVGQHSHLPCGLAPPPARPGSASTCCTPSRVPESLHLGLQSQHLHCQPARLTVTSLLSTHFPPGARARKTEAPQPKPNWRCEPGPPRWGRVGTADVCHRPRPAPHGRKKERTSERLGRRTQNCLCAQTRLRTPTPPRNSEKLPELV